MAGTKQGGKKAVKTLRERYGSDYFHKLGLKGGNPVLLKYKQV
jgi:hypothetical protein